VQDLNIFSMFLNAGPMVKFVMLMLLAFSGISWFIVFQKFILFKKARQESEEFLEVFWNCKNLAEAFKSAQSFENSPEPAIFRLGFSELQKLNRNKDDKKESTLQDRLAGMETLKRVLQKGCDLQSAHLGKSLSFLATTGSTTPFIGLFGTVWGIMASFKEIGMRGSASLAVVAPGISEALVATAAGLAVAIPAVIFYNFYANKLADMESEMMAFMADFLNLVERDLITRR
jgi:biopolymer transport protein TolQ